MTNRGDPRVRPFGRAQALAARETLKRTQAGGATNQRAIQGLPLSSVAPLQLAGNNMPPPGIPEPSASRRAASRASPANQALRKLRSPGPSGRGVEPEAGGGAGRKRGFVLRTWTRSGGGSRPLRTGQAVFSYVCRPLRDHFPGRTPGWTQDPGTYARSSRCGRNPVREF
jgi:hypothetical protein